MSLTIGMAVFSDWDGAYFSLQSLHAHHPHVDYLVIDNAPKGDARLAAVTRAIGGRYLHRPDLHGTSAPRDAIFRLAKTEWAMCIDSHVLLETGAVHGLLNYIEEHRQSNDLLTGPMVGDDGVSLCTHWRRDESTGGVGLWGTWDTAWQSPDGQVFVVRGSPNGQPLFLDLDNKPVKLNFSPAVNETLEQWLVRNGCKMGGIEPFEIPMQGLGLFAMRCKAWPGFHPLFRGFGGEEGYIHEKVRQRGGKNLCLPKLRWRHRFRDPSEPIPYQPRISDHTWNLLIGHRELGIDATEPIRKTFGARVPAHEGTFEQLKQQAEIAQPWHTKSDRRRLKLLGVWYTNNSAPELLMQRSLATIKRAVDETMHHDVRVCTSSWTPIPGNPFGCVVGKPNAQPGHAAIIAQVRACIGQADSYVDVSYPFDAVVFLEHDVLIGPGYFDKVGDAFVLPDNTTAPVVSSLDYEGLNATGWLKVKERHEPMHELSMRKDVCFANLDRAEEDCKAQGWALLEPQGDRSDWVRMPPVGLCANIHVNW